MNKRKIACVAWWLGSLPFRVLIVGFGTIFMPLAIPVWFLCDLHRYGCKEEKFYSWDDWYSLALPKLIYWDFLICGRTEP